MVLGLFGGDDHPFRALLTSLLGDGASSLLERRRFRGKPGACVSFDRPGAMPASLTLVGLGAPERFELAGLRTATALGVKAAARLGCRQIGLLLPVEGLLPEAAAAAMGEAARLGLYSDHRYRSEPDPDLRPERCTLLGLPSGAEAGLEGIDAVCAGVELARQLVASPPNRGTPEALAAEAAAIASTYGLALTVLERSDCEALGMGAYLGAVSYTHLTLPTKA